MGGRLTEQSGGRAHLELPTNLQICHRLSPLILRPCPLFSNRPLSLSSISLELVPVAERRRRPLSLSNFTSLSLSSESSGVVGSYGFGSLDFEDEGRAASNGGRAPTPLRIRNPLTLSLPIRSFGDWILVLEANLGLGFCERVRSFALGFMFISWICIRFFWRKGAALDVVVVDSYNGKFTVEQRREKKWNLTFYSFKKKKNLLVRLYL